MKIFSLIFAVFLSHNLTADLKVNLDEQIEDLMPKVIEWRHDIHQYPELGNREFRTSKKLKTILSL